MRGPFFGDVHAKFVTLLYGLRHEPERQRPMNAPVAFAATAKPRAFSPVTAVPVLPKVTTLNIAELRADAALLAEWDELAASASEPNPFGERWYLEAALTALGGDDICVAIVRDDALIGIMPLITQSHYAGLPIAHVQNWLNHNAFLGTPLVRKGTEQQFWAALLGNLDSKTHSGLFLH